MVNNRKHEKWNLDGKTYHFLIILDHFDRNYANQSSLPAEVVGVDIS